MLAAFRSACWLVCILGVASSDRTGASLPLLLSRTEHARPLPHPRTRLADFEFPACSLSAPRERDVEEAADLEDDSNDDERPDDANRFLTSSLRELSRQVANAIRGDWGHGASGPVGPLRLRC
jgi:hypothetical protein